MRTNGQETARVETPRQRAPAFRWSWKLVTAAGIDVHIHGTLFLLIAFVTFSGFVAGQGLSAVLRGTLLILATFSTVMLHEFGHVLTARRFGVRTLDIMLLPLGTIGELLALEAAGQQTGRPAVLSPMVGLRAGAGTS